MPGVIGTDRARETVRILRDNITSGRWPLNSKIPTEPELAAELGVGRSTIREAVRSLANLGMLEPARSRGTFVRSRNPVSAVLSDFVHPHEITEILAVRRTLEVEAAKLAAEHRTEHDLDLLTAAHRADVTGADSDTVERGLTPGQFHAMVFEAAHNHFLAELYAGMMSALRSRLADGSVVHRADADTRRRDHAEILEAISDGDVARSADRAAAHADHDLVVADGASGEKAPPATLDESRAR